MPLIATHRSDSGTSFQLRQQPTQADRGRDNAVERPYPLEAAQPARLTHPSGNDSNLWIGLDGFFSNHSEVAAKLTNSADRPVDDLSLIARLYQAGNPDALFMLEGCFALIIIDPERDRLVALRDRLGGRRLCWREQGGQLVVASRSTDLIKKSSATPDENASFIARLMGLSTSHNPAATTFVGIHELEPGQCLICDDQGLHLQRQSFSFGHTDLKRSVDQWVEEFTATLTASVSACLGPSGPVASMLSGGLDSGPVSVIAHRVLQNERRSLIPVSWLLPQHPQADESEHILSLADYLGVASRSFNGSAMTPFGRLESEFISPELPMYNAFRELVLECYRQAAGAGCRIILNGHAGDTLYTPRGLLLSDALRRRDFSALIQIFGRIARGRGLRGLWKDPAIREPFGRSLSPLRTPGQAPAWLSAAARKHWNKFSQTQWPPETSQHHLPEHARNLLGTRMTFGLGQENDFPTRFGIERRDPYQNESLVRLMLQMPAELSHRNGRDKWVMRRAMRGQMPEQLRLKQRTGLLGSFFDDGFERNRKQIHQLLIHDQRQWQQYVRPEYINNALKSNSTSTREKLVINRCVGYALWRQYWEKQV